jgi:hypothetical protein
MFIELYKKPFGSDKIEYFLIDLQSGWEIYDKGEGKEAQWVNHEQARNLSASNTYAEVKAKLIESGQLVNPKQGGRKAPWQDYKGNDIFEGDIVEHFDGDCGLVVCVDGEDPWRVKYATGLSRLQLQVGDKGRAVVKGKG